MLHTVRVTAAAGHDPAGEDLCAEIHRTLGLEAIARVRTARVYRLEGVGPDEARQLAEQLLAEEIDSRWTLDAPILYDTTGVVEVAYHPGVMNPEVASILKAAGDIGLPLSAADSSREYAFYGPNGADVPAADVRLVLRRLLVNPTIEHVVTHEPATLLRSGVPGETRTVPLSELDDAGLERLSAAGLYLSLAELGAIRDYFGALGRDPTDLELEVLAQTWSEHCGHKTFKATLIVDGQRKPSLISRLKDTAAMYDDLTVSAFVDNSGVMRFYDGWAVAGKVETHNSPSAIEPYGGAMTGSGGVFRDVLGTGQGAAVIASTDVFCVAPPDLQAADVPPGALSPDYLLRRVVAGVRDYGNRMGIPTNNGSLHFHPDFRAKPTVIVGAYGLLPESRAAKGRPAPGDRILVLGGRTGRDGIHGATFSSAAMTADTMAVNAQAVQIGNAIEERRLLDALLACRDADLVRAVTDCGAGGFSSAIGEMAEGLGATVHLERAPVKYPGLAPWEIFVSESQERMVLAVAPTSEAAVRHICELYNVEVADLGTFEATGRLVVRFDSLVAGDLDLAFLHDGCPVRELTAVAPAPGHSPKSARVWEHENDPLTADWRSQILTTLGDPNVASKEPIVRQYDHTVQAMSVLASFGGATGQAPSDAAVLAPLLDQPYGLVIAHGLNPALMAEDAYWGAVWAATEAVSNLVAVGGNPRELSLIDNFIWPVPRPEQLWALDRAVDACVDVMHALKRPFISGKDSLSSTYRYPDGRLLEIPPVLCVSVFGRIPDVSKTVSSDLKQVGSLLVRVGGGDGLRVDLARLPAVLDAVHAAIDSGAVLSCHDVSEGGLVAAVAEMAFGGGIGARLELEGDLAAALLAETAGVFVVELPAASDPMALFGAVPHLLIGRTSAEPLIDINHAGRPLVQLSLDELHAAWVRPMRDVFHSAQPGDPD